MGSCVARDSFKKQSKPDGDATAGQSIDQIFNFPTDILMRSRGKDRMPTAKSTMSAEQNISTLQERLMNQEQLQLEQWKNLHSNCSSVILKRPNKSKRQPKTSPQQSQAINSIVNELRGTENIDGNIIQQKNYSKLKIGNQLANIEFLLPRSRGGPLVVPYLLYQHYSPV